MAVTIFNRNRRKKPVAQRPNPAVWAHLQITEHHLRELVRLRIEFLDKTQSKPVSPDEPDLSGLLEEFSKDIESRMIVMLIWHEEVKRFYNNAVAEASQRELDERIRKNPRTKKD